MLRHFTAQTAQETCQSKSNPCKKTGQQTGREIREEKSTRKESRQNRNDDAREGREKSCRREKNGTGESRRPC